QRTTVLALQSFSPSAQILECAFKGNYTRIKNIRNSYSESSGDPTQEVFTEANPLGKLNCGDSMTHMVNFRRI
ncbi:MAG: hypothetical protein AAF560_13310, partial [Acidobacteriota bacterium]